MDGLRGQSEVLGYALILGFTLISVGALVAFGGGVLDSTRSGIGAQQAEQAISQLDSRASLVALGDSDRQQLSLGNSEGSYTVDPTAGRLTITHESESGDERLLYNESLGAVRYSVGSSEIAYQGGGVWRKDAGSVMLSPPEFHYRGSTLTLPVIKIQGEGSISGGTRADLGTQPQTKVFPTGGGGNLSSNPVDSGDVTVAVSSEYYTAWAEFFRSRTEGNVSVDHGNETTSVTLVAPDVQGPFDMFKGDSVTLRGIYTHQIDEFTLTLIDDSDQADFSNLKWSMCANSGNQRLGVHVEASGNPGHNDSVDTWVKYTPDGEATQTWYTDDFVVETEEGLGEDFTADGDYDDMRVKLNLTEPVEFTFTDEKPKTNCDFDADDTEEEVTFDGHEDVSWEPESYESGDSENIDRIFNHYIANLGPVVDLEFDHKGQSVSEQVSSGYIEYNQSKDFYLTYMHVTENPVNVTVR